ncbi:MAG: HAMP domain-containing histidine kinase [Brevinematales bacterium]|nr:HAMP domain-containing histidine kinase [Brevinematales bacterium]
MNNIRRFLVLLGFLDNRTKLIISILVVFGIIFIIQLLYSIVNRNILFAVESFLMVIGTGYGIYLILRYVCSIASATKVIKRLHSGYYPLSSVNEFPVFVIKNFYSILRNMKILEEKNNTMLKLFQNIKEVGLVVVDKDKNVVFYNDFVREFFGLHGNYIGKKFYSLFTLSSSKLRNPGSDLPHKLEVISGRGKRRLIKMYQNTINDLTVIYFFDITNFKKLESVVDITMSIISHELKTPITNLSLAIENILMSKEFSERVINIALSNISRITNTISNIMSLSNINTKRFVINKEEFNIKQVIQGIVENILPSYQEKLIKFEFQCIGNEFVYEDKEKMSLILFNLIENAFKFSPKKGIVRVLVDNTDKLLISISNTASYISDDDLERIFNKFYRAKNSLGVRGSGLGLYIVKVLSKILGFKVEVSRDDSIIIFRVFRDNR